MAALLFPIHTQDTFNLVKTLAIKCTPVANFINTQLIKEGHTVLDSAPRTWKHHMNMCGDYHYTNEMMYITSIDTQEVIEFTKANLAIHLGTAKEYAYGTNFHKELEEAYPQQKSLILGILNPVNMDTLMAAPEGKILSYDKSLVEAQEFDLIPRLQGYINHFLDRWLIKGFPQIEENYIKVFVAELYAPLAGVIEAIRLSNVRSPRAHSFHISQYLAGYFRLDEQYHQLSHKQRMWLYFNIDYVKNNIGSQESFDLLVQKILTDRSIPLSTYEIVQSTLEQVEDLLPTPLVREIPVNMRSDRTGSRITDLDELLGIVHDAAKDNHLVELEEIDRINSAVPYSSVGSIKTKVFRSSIVDLSESNRFKLTEALVSSWIWLASTNRFLSTIPFTNPGSGEIIRLRANDAFIALMYFLQKSEGIEPTVIPQIQVFDMPRPNAPNFAELRGLSNTRYITKAYIDEALTDLIQPETYISIQAYRNFAVSLYKRQTRHYYQWYGLHDFNARSQAERITMRIYDSVVCTLTTHSTFDAWLLDKGLNFDNLDRVAFTDMFNELLTNATGIGEDAAVSAAAIQRAMIEIMRKLTPYNVLFQDDINTEPFIDLTRDVTSISFAGYGAKQISEIIDIFPEILTKEGRHYQLATYMDAGTRLESIRVPDEKHVFEINNQPDMSILWKNSASLTMSNRLEFEIEEEEVPLTELTPNNVLSGFNYPE